MTLNYGGIFMAKKNRARKIVNNAATNKTATTPVKEPTSPVEEKATVTEEVTETVAETTVETTEKVETVVKETTTAADEAVPQETEEKEAPKSFLDDPDLIDDQDPETQEEPEPAPETEGESFNEDEMFADTPVDRIETITGEEYKKALRKRFFMENGISMESYKKFIDAVSFGLLSDDTVTGIALLFMQQISEEDKTSYNMKAVEAFIKFGLMGRKESMETYLPETEYREALEKLTIAMDQLSERQDIILSAQLDNMLRNFFGLVFAKPVFSPDDIKRREEEAAKAKAKADKAAEKAAKAAEKAAKKESKKKAPEAEAADEAANPQTTEETSQEKSEKKKMSFKDKIAAAKKKAAAKKAAKEAAKENKEDEECNDGKVEFECNGDCSDCTFYDDDGSCFAREVLR